MGSFVRVAAVFGVLGVSLLSGSAEQALAAAVPAGLPPTAVLLLRFDANHDGVVTRAEMDAGLTAAYAAADTNHDGCLDKVETKAENERRLRQDGGVASPLYDWNLDGCVSLAEFSNTVHSYFGFVDKTKNGEVTLLELRGPSMPLPQPGDNKNDGNAKKLPPDVDIDPGVSY